jgi:hypothetical protein
VLLDDRLLIEEILHGLELRVDELWTTTYWYYRACRAATLGSQGHLSGPFERLPAEHHEAAVLGLLQLPDRVGIADARVVVPVMAALSSRHPQLNLLNLEAAAAAAALAASVLLSAAGARGVLPAVLDAERVEWVVRQLD